jgi:hypothetical protein
MAFIESFIPGVGGTFDERVVPLNDHDHALALMMRSYHCLAHTLIDGALTLARNGEGERTEMVHAMLGPALSMFATAWRARVAAGSIEFGGVDPEAWLDKLVGGCEFVDVLYSLLVCASAGDHQWYEHPPSNVTRLIRHGELPEVPLLASEIMDLSDYAQMVANEVEEAVACAS